MSGLTSAGLVPKTLDEIRTELEARFRSVFGANVQLDPQSVLGQLVGVLSEREASVWELAEDVYSSAYLASASGASLDDLGALVAVVRPPAELSVVTLHLTGTNGTNVPAGQEVSDGSADGTHWITLATVVIGPTGVDVNASPADTGPIVALAGTLDTIETPVSGWTGVTNALDAVVGRAIASDAEYRTLIRLSMRSGGGSSLEGMIALLLRVEDVSEVAVIENVTDLPDSDGRPGHSFEAVVRGGVNQEIADMIWFAKPGGIATFGSIATTVVDTAGDNQTVNWSRPTDRNIYVAVVFEPGDGFPYDDDGGTTAGQALIESEILNYGDGFTMGQDVFAAQIFQHIETPGIESMTVYVGTVASPTADRVVIPRTHFARFDSARITFTEI